jgi:hypothetical protein
MAAERETKADKADAATQRFLKRARERFKLALDAEQKQRDREKDDLRFYAGDQWPPEVKSARAAQNGANGLPPVPARPCLTINKTREPVRQVLNQERQADMGVEIVPADDFGELVDPIDPAEIELREGLVRRIQRDSHAADARTWAFARAVQAGRGFYGVMTRYVPGKTNDQDICVHRYYNQSCVLLDPAHEQPDGSDAEWAFVETYLPWDVYTAEHPKRGDVDNQVCAWDDGDWTTQADLLPEWFSTEGDLRMVRVVDHWYTERASRELVTYGNGQQEITEWADEVPQAPEGFAEVSGSRRTVVEKSIKWAKLDGCDDGVLDATDWPGPDMPIVKVLGEELQPYDDERRVEGMVRPMREPGQGYNFMVSAWVERIGLAPLPPALIEEGTIEGYEAWWQASTTRTLPYLLYKRTNLENGQAAPPTVPPARNPDVAAIAGSIQVFDEAIQSTSGIHDPSLGKVDPSVKSGRAIQALQEQSARSSNHYLDNLQRSIRYEGQIINNLLYPIYNRPGRIARILNQQGDAEHVLLHQPMVMVDGKPVPASDGQTGAKTYTLTKDAQFNVVVKVSKNYDTRRQQEAAIIGELVSANPELMTWFGDLFFQNQDGPGHQAMADRAKVMLAPPIQQMLQAKQQGMDPQAAAAVAQKDQTIQQLQQQLQEASAPLAAEKLKQQTTLHVKDMDLTFQAQKAAADNETKLAVAELGAKVDRLALFLEERARLGVQRHEVGMSAMGHAQSLEQGQQAQDRALEAGAQTADLAMTQAEHAQAIAPPPEQAGA